MEEVQDISLRRKIWLWVAAWGAAVIACAIPEPALLAVAWLFPFGLFALCVRPQTMSDMEGLAAFGWIIYLGLSIFALRQRRPARYFVFYAVLCALLILNVVGCHDAASKIDFRT